jgi:UDP-3-O-[3-hydroxymyristoyl] glucosamine N-acyltransferase
MKLSDFGWLESLTILRDAEFKYAVKLHSLSEQGDNLIFVEQSSYAERLNPQLVSAVITTPELGNFLLSKYPEIGVAVCSNPKEVFYKIHIRLVETEYSKKAENRISEKAKIHPGAIIASSNVVIGPNTVVEEGAIIKEGVIIGENCLIQSGTVIGNDCFETATIDGVQRLIPHAGKVIIGNNVVIQSMCSISKGLFPTRDTVIEDEVIVADHVHIAHGVHIKKRARIAAGVIVAGYVTIGNGAWIGPGATVSNGINIGDNAFVTIGSTVVSNVDDSDHVAGNFAIDYKKFLKFMGQIRK